MSDPFIRISCFPWEGFARACAGRTVADMVVVTKCPDDLMPINFRIVSKDLDLMKYQKLFSPDMSMAL